MTHGSNRDELSLLLSTRTRAKAAAAKLAVPSVFSGRAVEAIAPQDIVEPYRSMLVHERSMTAKLSSFYDTRVHLTVLSARYDLDVMEREVLLSMAQGRTLAVASIRIYSSALPARVRDEVLAGCEPFGRILERHEVVRFFHPVVWLCVHASDASSGPAEDGVRASAPLPYAGQSFGRQCHILDSMGRCMATSVEVLTRVADGDPAAVPGDATAARS